MQIRLIKGQSAVQMDVERDDGSLALASLPNKGPIAHDLVHFVVESELGFDRGFWGLVAAGYSMEQIGSMAKAAGHPSAKRAETPDARFVQAIQAERIVESFEAELWSQGSDNASLRELVKAGCEQSKVPSPLLSDESIERIRGRLTALSAQWRALRIGESLSLSWTQPNRDAS